MRHVVTEEDALDFAFPTVEGPVGSVDEGMLVDAIRTDMAVDGVTIFLREGEKKHAPTSRRGGRRAGTGRVGRRTDARGGPVSRCIPP
ncbi:hypothetical protein Cma02nite_31660 [Cellulomonas marina]|nr:hypothetical protein Cma02nite_31660 [Cellulomonas marina]